MYTSLAAAEADFIPAEPDSLRIIQRTADSLLAEVIERKAGRIITTLLRFFRDGRHWKVLPIVYER